MTVGVLLPNSTTHPLIPHQFLGGMRAALKYHREERISLVPGYIGFGTDPELLKNETEKLLLSANADIIIAFADHPVVDVLFPLMDQLNKILIVVNNGAKYPLEWKAPRNVYFHTLENSYYCWLTAGYALENTRKAIMATSYYDGGYALCHALTQPFINAGGEILYNFAGSFKPEEFEIGGMANFLAENNDVHSIFAILSGNLVPEFYTRLQNRLPDTDLRLYGSPVMLEESFVLPSGLFGQGNILEGFLGWYEGAVLPENRFFCRAIMDETGRKADSFGALGWDTTLILMEIFKQAGADRSKLSSFNAALNGIPGAKGNLHANELTHHFIGDAYQLQFNGDQITAMKTISAPEGKKMMDEMIEQKIEGISSGWQNTYLCS
jgi:branched-chain amino acid transport system substrate-binding protein